MIHFHGNPNCGSRGSRDITSTADDLEEYSNLYRSDPWRYCSECLTPESIRTDSERYAELRALVEAWQSAHRANDQAETAAPETEGRLKRWLNFCDAQKPLLDWNHR